ncbi:hypothetical protein ACV35N_37650, partial [Pseudomonas aeruginosa]
MFQDVERLAAVGGNLVLQLGLSGVTLSLADWSVVLGDLRGDIQLGNGVIHHSPTWLPEKVQRSTLSSGSDS